MDTFFLQAPDIGSVTHVRVRSSGAGAGAAWHLASICVTHSGSGLEAGFRHGNWLDQKHGLEVLLGPAGSAGAAGPPAEVAYEVAVFTSDVRGAGTDANVFIELHGDKGSVGQMRLESGANNFERDQCDVFVVKGSDVGQLQRVVVWHDNNGPGPDWHLQQVSQLLSFVLTLLLLLLLLLLHHEQCPLRHAAVLSCSCSSISEAHWPQP